MRGTKTGILVAVLLVSGLWALPAGAKHGRPADRVAPPDRVEQQRFAMAHRDDRGAASVFRACERALIGRQATNECVRAGLAFRGAAVPAIQACGQAMIGDAATLRCIEHASRARFPAANLVRACDRALIGNQAQLQCIAAASRSWRDPAPVVGQCARASIGNNRTLACIDRTLDALARR